MLQYPSIDGAKKAPLGKPCTAFYKYDGSNLRWEWSPKRGWNKFGTRRQLFDKNTPLYNQAIEIWFDGMADIVEKHVRDNHKGCERITAFTEFFGPSSFAGSHDEHEAKELKLFDVFVFKKGFITPKKFIDLFGEYDWSPEVIYEGNFNKQFIEDVRAGKYHVYEGVIAKGDDWSAKVKTNEYLARLKNNYGPDWEKYAE